MSGPPDLLVYTQASPEIGHGHARRCAALAEEAHLRGLRVGFACSDPYTTALVAEMGEEVVPEPAAAPPYVIRDLLHGSSVEDVRRHRQDGARVLLLDDLTPARTVADLVCDSLMTADRVARYPHSDEVTYLYGLEYAPLRRQFMEKAAEPRRAGGGGEIRLLVSFGGSDPLGITRRFVRGLHDSGYRGPATIVVDPSDHEEVAAVVRGWRETVVATGFRDMADVIHDADLVATKTGMTVLESFCLGAGCVLVEPSRAHLDLAGLLEINYPGWPAAELGLEDEVDFLGAAAATSALLADRARLTELGVIGSRLVDGQGVTRIIDALVAGDERTSRDHG